MIGAHHPDLFSAFAPCCAYGDPTLVASKLAGKPVWAFHGEKDDVVPPADTKRMIEAIRAQHKSPDPKLTLYPDANHNCWDNAYNNENLGLWLLHPRNCRGNIPPDFRFPISDFRFPISDFRFPISDFRFPISDFRFPSPRSAFRVPTSAFHPSSAHRSYNRCTSACAAPSFTKTSCEAR